LEKQIVLLSFIKITSNSLRLKVIQNYTMEYMKSKSNLEILM